MTGAKKSSAGGGVRPEKWIQILLRTNIVSADELQEARAQHERSGRPLALVLADRPGFEAPRYIRALVEGLGLAAMDITQAEPDRAALERVQLAAARRMLAIPIALDSGDAGETLLVAAGEPLTDVRLRQLRQAAGCPIDWRLASPRDVGAAIEQAYAAKPPPLPAKKAPPARGEVRVSGANAGSMRDWLDVPEMTPAPRVQTAPGQPPGLTSDRPRAATVRDPATPMPDLRRLERLSSKVLEEDKTVEVDEDDPALAAVFQTLGAPPRPPPIAEVSARVFEVPVAMHEESSPFDDVAPVNIPIGLDDTAHQLGDDPLGEGFDVEAVRRELATSTKIDPSEIDDLFGSPAPSEKPSPPPGKVTLSWTSRAAAASAPAADLLDDSLDLDIAESPAELPSWALLPIPGETPAAPNKDWLERAEPGALARALARELIRVGLVDEDALRAALDGKKGK